jgi:glutamyl-tRNA reductase
MSIVVLGLSHRTSPVELREQFAFAEAVIPPALSRLRADGIASEAVILSTCNRVELYAVTPLPPAEADRQLRRFLSAVHTREVPAGDELYSFPEPHSVHHLFKVACGLDSMVLGETEILGQLKKAYDLALQHGHTGARLNKAFQRAFHVAKHIRTHTNIQRGSISVASVAVELAEKIFGALDGHEVMVIGAGDTSEKTARALLSRGAKNIVVANRSYDRAEALARELGGRPVRFEDWAEEFEKVDIVVSSTAAPNYVLDQARLEPLMRARRHRPLLLIDIAVPRDIDPAVNQMDNVYLYNVDDLQSIASDYLEQRRDEIIKCEAIIREKAEPVLEPKPARGNAASGDSRPQPTH